MAGRVLLFLFLAWFGAGATAVFAWDYHGFNINIISIPLGPNPVVHTNAFPFNQSIEKYYSTAAFLVNDPLSAGDLQKLKQHPPFSTMTDAEAQAKFALIRRTVLDAINLISKQYPDIADCLWKIYQSGQLSIAFGGTPGVCAEIREDGSPDCGDEAINLYKFPCPTNDPPPLYATEMFQLVNTLAHEGLHAKQAGYTAAISPGWVPYGVQQTNEAREALTNQCREMEAALAELSRMDDLSSVLQEIINNQQLPAGATGIAAAIGKSILNAFGLTPEQKRQKARELWAFVQGNTRAMALQTLECRTAYKRALQAWLVGEFNQTNSIARGVRQTGWFMQPTIRDFGEFQFISYLAGYFMVGTNYGTNYSALSDPFLYPAIVRASNVLRQIAASITTLTITQRVFSVPGIKHVTGGLWRGDWLFLIGDAPDDINGALWAYRDLDNDGLLDEASGTPVLTSPNFYDAATFGLNSGTGAMHVMNRRTRNLFELGNFNGNGLPTSITSRGQVSATQDILYCETSPDGKFIWGANDFNRPLGRSFRRAFAGFNDTTSQFQPLGSYEVFAQIQTPPALAELLAAGANRINITDTPNIGVRAFLVGNGGPTQIGITKVDPAGHATFGLNIPLVADDEVYFVCDSGLRSPTYLAEDVSAPQFFEPVALLDGQFRFEMQSSSRTPCTVGCSLDLKSWFDLFTMDSGRFGKTFAITDGATPRKYLRGLAGPIVLEAVRDEFTVPPGVGTKLHIGFNDRLRPGTTFEFFPVPSDHPDRVSLSAHGELSFAALADVNQYVFNYRIIQGGQTSAPAPVVINLDTNLLINPPVFSNDVSGTPFVAVPCLVLANKHYPMYQFRLRNNPADVCQQPHWHWVPGRLVYPIEMPTQGIPDPNQPSCGFGTYAEVPREDFIFSLSAWNEFKMSHPP